MSRQTKGRQRIAAGPASPEAIEAGIAALNLLSLEELRQTWRTRLQTKPPPIRSRDILLRMLAWQMQAKAFGGFDSSTQRKLRQMSAAFAKDPAHRPTTSRSFAPGVVLTREWKGVVHHVTVASDGYLHLGHHYASLSDVARTITGTRWSGPRFFGLEPRSAKIAQETAS